MVYIYTMKSKYSTCKECIKTYLQLKINASYLTQFFIQMACAWVHYSQNKKAHSDCIYNIYNSKQI